MMRSPLFWFAAGAGSVWVYHHFVKPLPGAASGG
jgi:hypothetical protein